MKQVILHIIFSIQEGIPGLFSSFSNDGSYCNTIGLPEGDVGVPVAMGSAAAVGYEYN
jgi:hypothetical protein